MVLKDKVEVLDPTVKPDVKDSNLANRPETLDGAVVGLLANGKKNSVEILKYVYDVISEEYDLKLSVEEDKGNASRPCPSEMLLGMAETCDVVITSNGD